MGILLLVCHAMPQAMRRRATLAAAGSTLVLVVVFYQVNGNIGLAWAALAAVAPAFLIIPLAKAGGVSLLRAAALLAVVGLALLVAAGADILTTEGYGYDKTVIVDVGKQQTLPSDYPRPRILDEGVYETRTIALEPSGEEAELRIVRSGEGAARSMDLLEYSVRTIAEFMGDATPFVESPTTLVFDDRVFSEAENAGASGFGYHGGNLNGHLFVKSEFDVDDGSFQANGVGMIIAHEAAHRYWHSNAKWMTEGAASFLASYSESQRTRGLLVPHYSARLGCGSLSNMGSEVYCPYLVGERFFFRLHQTLGGTSFRRGFRNWYSRIKGRRGDIGDVVDAFKEGATPEESAAADRIVRVWYHGAGLIELPEMDAPVNPALKNFNGRIDRVYVGTAPNRPVARLTAENRNTRLQLYVEALRSQPTLAEEPETIPLEIVEYIDFYGYGIVQRRSTALWQTGKGINWHIPIESNLPDGWVPGRYGILVSEGRRKVANVTWEVVK